MEQIAGWIAPIATMMAAMMTAANLGARITGWGFIVFTVGSVAWSVVAVSTGQSNLLWTNGFLTIVNIVGIWRWLGRQARYDDGGEVAAKRSAAAARAPSLFAVGSIAGVKLLGKDGIAIGAVIEGMMQCSDTRLAYVVVSEGGIGGIGERLHALSVDELSFADGTVQCRMTAEDLQQRPVLEDEAWPASLNELSRSERVTRHG